MPSNVCPVYPAGTPDLDTIECTFRIACLDLHRRAVLALLFERFHIDILSGSEVAFEQTVHWRRQDNGGWGGEVRV